MLLIFDEMTPVPMEHFKGGVGTLQARPYDDGNCKVLQMTLPQGTSIGLHTHEGSCEMIFVLSGEGICLDDGEEYPFRPGMCHYCPEGHSHSVFNTGSEPLVLLGVVPNLQK